MDIDHIAKLAKLDIKKEEAQKLKKELELILGYVEKLSEVDTKDIVPTGHSIALENVMAEDVPINQGIRENGKVEFRDELLKNTKKVKDGMIVTPKILE